MIAWYYQSLCLVSFILTLIYVKRWHKHFDVYFSITFTLIPLTNLGYLFLAYADYLETAVTAQKIIYIGDCFLIFFIMCFIFALCEIRFSPVLRTLAMLFLFIMYGFILTIGHYPFFYKEVSFEKVGERMFLGRVYGPVHTLFFWFVILLFAVSFAAILYSYLKKIQVSRRILLLLFLPELAVLIGFFRDRMVVKEIELVPAAYVFVQVIYLMLAREICIHDVSDAIIDSILETGDTGFVSVDFKERYLGSSETAKRIMPELLTLTVDRPAAENALIRDTLLTWLTSFRKKETDNTFFYKKDQQIYKTVVQYLYDDRKKRGYQFVISDDTRNQRYISLINHFNTDLEAEVRRKTKNLVAMQSSLVMGMATMVESRDNSTGGHIRRTSDGVRILVEEMKKDPSWHRTDKFYADLIKAAPMHDLGKIAVDDAILRKPGGFTEEEFEKMKAHTTEGARIVGEILKGTDDGEFRILAENVAHYHHERWDGSGYPKGLKGEDIPLEARIMAIADVFDALVSKRAYKDKMPLEKADEIIRSGMGSQFDSRLEPCYTAAFPVLKAYYRGL